jgi:hypothetical protein
LEEVKAGLEQTKSKKEALLSRKAEIDAIREKGGKSWTDELQKELETVTANITELELAEVGLTEAIAKMEAAIAENANLTAEEGYVCPKGKEKLVHLLLQEGKKYSSTTGKMMEAAIAENANLTAEEGYVCPKGKEKLVHLLLQEGKKYSSTTGKMIAGPFVQYFTRSEFQLFKLSYKNLGYSVLKVLYDPYGEAEKLLEA